jgi:hypothetical protein
MAKIRKLSLKDFVIYVAVNALILGAVFAMFCAGMSWDFFIKWIGFIIVTAVLFGLFIQDSRTLLREKSFRFLLAFVFLAHCALWIAILAYVKHWKFIWFYPILIEMAIFQYSGNRLLYKMSDHTRRHHG